MSVIQNEELMNELMEATDKKELISILEKIEK
jgi:mannitol/fructose-specific phosphotransferase system IIA component (Ntr-type)